MARPRRLWPLWLRLALAFVGVTLAAVVVLTGLTAVSSTADISRLSREQQADLAGAIAAAAGTAHSRSGQWAGADLSPVVVLVTRTGAGFQVRDLAGSVVRTSPGFPRRYPGHGRREPVVVRGRQVGSVMVRFGRAGLAAFIDQFQARRRRELIIAAGIAALFALLVALVISRRITAPIGRLMDVVRARGRGQINALAGDVRGPRELNDLAVAFDHMVDSLSSQEKIRRNLVADVAHELRTPIAVLQAGHEALLDGVSEPSHAQLTSLRDEVLRLADMVDDLQRLASAEAAALQLALGPCDLARIAVTATDSLARAFEAAGVSLQRRLTEVQVLGDPGRLHEVIMNLLSNALKFTSAGGYVAIETGPHGQQATLRVSDTGVGIPADELPHIFDRFFRGKRAAAVAGSGIGLAVVAELVRAHDGTLDVSSDAGQGTEVTLTLPRA